MHTLKLIFILISLVILSGCDQISGVGDVKASEYDSFQQASEQRAFELGWLPRAMPRSAVNIIEAHNVDSGEVWIKFHSSISDVDNITAECVASGADRLPNAKRTRRSAKWWPKELTNENIGKHHESMKFFYCPQMHHAESIISANMGVDVSNNTVWYWVSK